MKINWRSSTLIFGVGILLAAGVAVAVASVVPKVSFVRGASVSTIPSQAAQPSAVTHLSTPTPVRAVYMTQCVVGTPSFRSELVDLIEKTELNAIVIDIKDYSGGIAFPTDNPVLKPFVSTKCGAADMKRFVASLHEKNIYIIGRITVFQDPLYTKAHPELAVKKSSDTKVVWKDHKGLSFIDVGARPFWEYISTLSKESYALGFDELNFDYIRFPSDGDMKDIAYTWNKGKTKQEGLENFFKYLHDQLAPTGVVMSADLFGMVTTNYDDLNIGQVLERALPYFDYIDPMVYPSHYPTGFNGYTNVNEHPYDIVNFSLAHAVKRTVATTTGIASFAYTRIGTSTPAIYQKPSYPASKIRPWLQSFDYPVTYTPAMVAAQIKATTDVGLDSYLFWDPSNKYRSLKEVLSKE
ncbi:MAG: putative glycoside hydrolase [bacterium]|nr:putative glycoside hydrolase [bacterium]